MVPLRREKLTPNTMNGLTWLHLSDWHQRGADFDRRVVRDALLADLRDRATLDPALAEVDFVIFSGDAAWAGKAEEFKAAREVFFDPVLGVLKDGGLSPEKLFFVPGNHDLSRAHVEMFLPPALLKPLEDDAEVQNWLTNDKGRACALGPFEDYTAFVTDYTGQKPAAYANTWNGFIGNKTVGILCLNSAWMCGRNKNAQGEVNDLGFRIGAPARVTSERRPRRRARGGSRRSRCSSSGPARRSRGPRRPPGARMRPG